jgi:sterol carrier protein 2
MHNTLAMRDRNIWTSMTPEESNHRCGTHDGYRYGAKAEDFAEIARISHEHSQRNPYAQFRTAYSLDQILDPKTQIYGPLTKLQCSPTSDGAAAAVIVSQRFLDARPHLKSQAILMAGQQLMTDGPEVYSRSAIDLVGFNMSRQAAQLAMQEAGVEAKDVKVCELHDCFSTNELLLLDALGFSEPGKAHEMVRCGDITYGGRGPVINPSGGLISKGHPLGATGLAQCAELTWQLRGWANNRLVSGTDVALQHNLGLGGAVVVTIYKRADGKATEAISDEIISKVSGLGYNPAVEARYITPEDGERVRSTTKRHDYPLLDTTGKLKSRM